jgi:hypothetical protein
MPNDSTEAPDPAQAPTSKPGLWETFISRVRGYAYRKFPLLFFKMRVRESLAWHYKKDSITNEETAPDSEESIQLHCLWAVEFYTPAHAENLISAFSALGWDKPDSQNESPAEWLRKSRMSYGGGGWINLGFIHPHGSRRHAMWPDRTAPLPDNVEFATAHMFNLTSSITCIVIRFLFKPAYRSILDDALRKEYVTFAKPLSRGYSLVDPRSQKQTQVSNLREDIRLRAKNWFRQNAPGIFAANADENDIPTCEFLTLKKAEPFSPASQGKQIDAYVDILGLRHVGDHWTADEFVGLKFGWPLLRDQDQFHSVLAINESNFSQYDLQMFGGSTASGFLAFIDLTVQAFLTRWACIRLLQHFERRLNRIRDAKSFHSLKRDRGSSFRRFPIQLKPWHGGPPITPSGRAFPKK